MKNMRITEVRGKIARSFGYHANLELHKPFAKLIELRVLIEIEFFKLRFFSFSLHFDDFEDKQSSSSSSLTYL